MISFSIAVGFNRKSRTATFISILRTNDSISIQKLFVHGKMAVIFLGNCGLPALPFHCLSHQPTSPADTAQLERRKPEPPHHGKGGGNTAPCCLTKGSPKIPTEHCSSVSRSHQRPGQHATDGKASFSVSKKPCLPIPGLNESSRSVNAEAEDKYCL